MVADQWFMQIEKVSEAMEITSDVTWIRLAAFQLEGEAWVEFQELFMGKYFPEIAKA